MDRFHIPEAFGIMGTGRINTIKGDK